MSDCENCNEYVWESDRLRCVGCRSTVHDYCAEADGWKQNPDGEWECAGCVETRLGDEAFDRAMADRKAAEIDAAMDADSPALRNYLDSRYGPSPLSREV